MGFLTGFWRKWYYNRSNGKDGTVLGAMGREVRQRYTGNNGREAVIGMRRGKYFVGNKEEHNTSRALP